MKKKLDSKTSFKPLEMSVCMSAKTAKCRRSLSPDEKIDKLYQRNTDALAHLKLNTRNRVHIHRLSSTACSIHMLRDGTVA